MVGFTRKQCEGNPPVPKTCSWLQGVPNGFVLEFRLKVCVIGKLIKTPDLEPCGMLCGSSAGEPNGDLFLVCNVLFTSSYGAHQLEVEPLRNMRDR